MKAIFLVPLIACALLSYSALGVEEKTTKPAGGDIIAVLEADGHYGTLLRMLDEARLTEDLRGRGPFTLFAPTDRAMQKFGNLQALRNDREGLRAALNNHIVEGRFSLADLGDRDKLMMRGGETWPLAKDGAMIGDAKITDSISASNGIVHGIDTLLMKSTGAAEVSRVEVRDEGQVERGLKDGTDKTYDGLKTGARKIKNFFTGN
ncbi:MAG TPA: fasciclin domain-containing protein [Planctomycetota bacterium]|nr:fasciclin domain-containing protein [Planctomycetota bacterium]